MTHLYPASFSWQLEGSPTWRETRGGILFLQELDIGEELAEMAEVVEVAGRFLFPVHPFNLEVASQVAPPTCIPINL